MFCRNCGSEIKEGRKFCTECGAPVAKKEEYVQQEEQKQQVREPEVQKPVESYVPQVSVVSEQKKNDKGSKAASVLKNVLKWFKGLNKKKKIIIIAVAVFVILTAFGKNGNSGSAETESYTMPTIPEITFSEADAGSETEAQTKAPETKPVETSTEKQTEKQTVKPTEKPTKKRTGIDPDFKEFWDSYEDYMDTYIKFMSSPDAMGSLEYLQVVAEYADWCSKIDDYDDSECTDEEVNYMLAVQSRVSAKMLQASLG